MLKAFATRGLAFAIVAVSAPANADPHICIGAMTDVEVLFHVRHDAYFGRKPLEGRRLRLEYDGCGYRVHVGASARDSRDGDVLLVDRFGHVASVVHQR
jgi:hypothetical protein